VPAAASSSVRALESVSVGMAGTVYCVDNILVCEISTRRQACQCGYRFLRLRADALQIPTTMAREKGFERRPICSVCRKSVAEGKPHYRAGLAWLHLRCYGRVQPKLLRNGRR
jgi:hypothetical protein